MWGCEDLGDFFVQAEDGIRGLVRSRGLGDVYKRQGRILIEAIRESDDCVLAGALDVPASPGIGSDATAVSYTHLTLPTSDLV